MFKLAPQGVSSLDVLVVEDDAVTRACLLQWLSRWGFRVEECSTLGDALARLSSGHEFAAVLLDQHLPDAAVETIAAQMKAIVGFEIAIDRLEGKWKLSQNKEANDRQGVIAGLQSPEDPHAHPALALRMRETDK